jgi:hypothetical protein
MGVFRRAAPMVGALFFLATLALVAVFDSEVRLDTRCQTASWRMRSAATKGQLRGGRRAVDAALAEMGCLPDARAAVVLEIAAGRDAAAAARDGARTAAPSVLVDPHARAAGTKSSANVPREIARAAAEKHEENVRRSGEATRADVEKKKSGEETYSGRSSRVHGARLGGFPDARGERLGRGGGGVPGNAAFVAVPEANRTAGQTSGHVGRVRRLRRVRRRRRDCRPSLLDAVDVFARRRRRKTLDAERRPSD